LFGKESFRMSTTNTQKQAAREFVREWTGKGYEKGETAAFWMALLHDVLGVENPVKAMEFEIPVKTITKEKGSDFIDGYITSTKVLIEQKGSRVDLSAKYRQSDGAELTPYQQARRYAAGLPVSMTPRWIVACNFQTFEVHDMEHPNDAPEIIRLADLEKEYHRLTFLVDDTNVHLKKELEVSIQAGEIVGVLYDKILSQYRNPEDPESQKALNKLCVRLVFCLYAEDAGIFGSKNMFHDYMSRFGPAEFREKLIKLFRILDQKPEDRDPYEDEALLAFPYVNGGLFGPSGSHPERSEGSDIEIPRFTEEIRSLILQRASDDFDWSEISPTIFGAVFESTLNPETRRAGGMHYTSIENIHKVIDPLFLDDLKAELSDIKATSVAKTRKDRAYAFQDKLSKLKFFDPACGSGNFLTESYTSLRRLENEALRIIYGVDRVIGEMADPIKVSINQFYGIEINDFACSVAQTALWIAESQMMQETDEIVGFNLDPLPLKTYTNIHEGNALRMDWNDVIPAAELNYIMGNPPFIGLALRNKAQQEDMGNIFPDNPRAGRLDYVTAWYKQAAKYYSDTNAEIAFVSTNSIIQGEQVPILWQDLISNHHIKINFAYRSFLWDSEAADKAHVHCVIIGFAGHDTKKKFIYDGNNVEEVHNINGYLLEADNVFIQLKKDATDGRPKIIQGNKPWDGGFLILTKEERDSFISKYPQLYDIVHPYIGSYELINGKERFCFWLKGVEPSRYRNVTEVMQRIAGVAETRRNTKTVAVQALADTPTLFAQIRQPSTSYMAIPEVSGESRKYIPLGYFSADVIASNKLFLIPEADLFVFGLLHSIVHNAWMRVVAGRLGMSYSYSPAVYNNFPWPLSTESQKDRIRETAQAILEARAMYPNSSLADMYDELTMPTELRKAHRANDAAVLEAYGFPKDATESDIVARLFKMYQELTK